MKYSFGRGLWKGTVAVLAFLVPVLVTEFPQWADLTVGGLLIMGVNYLKVKYVNL